MISKSKFLETKISINLEDSYTYFGCEAIQYEGKEEPIENKCFRYAGSAEVAILKNGVYHTILDRSDLFGTLEECEEALYKLYIEETTPVTEEKEEMKGRTPNKVQRECLLDLLKEFNHELDVKSKTFANNVRTNPNLADRVNVKRWLYLEVIIPAINEALINNKLKNW